MPLRTCAFVAAAALSAAALAGDFAGSTPVSLFGNTYTLSIFRVAGDLGPGLRLEPEGMTFHNGVLYVSGDGTAVETNGFLAAYGAGDLGSTPASIGRFLVGPNSSIFGPEGITVNTRATGYGSSSGGQPRLIALDNTPGFGRTLAVMNTATIAVEEVVTPFANADDAAYVPGASAATDRLAIVNGGTTPPRLDFYTTDANPVALSGSFNLPTGAKGLLFLPAVQASLFVPGAGDSLLVAADNGGLQNSLTLYALDGTQLAQSNLPTGTGTGLLGAIEALAFDPATGRLFIGDENGVNSQIAVLTIPAPGAAAFAGLAMIAAGRRRR